MSQAAWQGLARLASITARVVLASLSACVQSPSFSGVDSSSGQALQLAPGRMAPGHTFDGVYSSPQSGRMHLAQHGSQLEGQYAYHLCGCRVQGRLSGTADGDLARVEFSERLTDCAVPRELAGRGYLFYRVVSLSDTPAQLFGARAFLASTPSVAGGVRAERPSSAWTAVELDPREPVAPEDGTHCP